VVGWWWWWYREETKVNHKIMISHNPKNRLQLQSSHDPLV
jgi:hypothetical protein